MKLFFDTEFSGLRKNTDLISIGIVTDRNDVFYAEITDYDSNLGCDIEFDSNMTMEDIAQLCSKSKEFENAMWIRENVINQLFLDKPNSEKYRLFESFFGKGNFVTKRGTKYEVALALYSWLEDLSRRSTILTFVSDVSHYDFVLLIDLLTEVCGKTALDLPKYICPACYDINQLIADKYRCSFYEAFDMYRENIARGINMNTRYREILSHPELKHNSLFDAIVIQIIYEQLSDH